MSETQVKTPQPRHASCRGFSAKTTAIGSAAATGLFALQHHADAAIVYSDPTDIVVASTGGLQTFAFDMNGGGNDFQARVYNFPGTNPSGSVRLGTLSQFNEMICTSPGFQHFVKKLAIGTTIHPNILLPNATWNRSPVGQPMRKSVAGPFAGPWVTGQTGFAGVRLLDTVSSLYYYGWIRMRVDNLNPADGAPDQVTIFDWAYQNTIDTPLKAGETSTGFVDPIAVPEPSRALLLLAGAGAALLRRRRKSGE